MAHVTHTGDNSATEHALRVALTVAQEYESDADSRAQLLEQALWSDDDEYDSHSIHDGNNADGMLLELLANDEHSHAHNSNGSVLIPPRGALTAPPRPPPQFQPLQVATLTNRRNLARRSRTKMFTYKPNKTRDGRREELLYLNQKVSELEAQLGELQRRHGLSSTRSTRSSSSIEQPPSESRDSTGTNTLASTALPMQRSLASSVWRAIASRQSDERNKAERENIRLRLVLEHQLKIARSLEGILHKKLQTKDIEKCVQTGAVRHAFPSTNATDDSAASDARVFADLVAGVAQSYAEVDAVFATHCVAAAATDAADASASDAQVRSDGAGGMFLAFVATKVVPFSVMSTGAAVWQHFVVAKERTPARFYSNKSNKNIDATHDVVSEHFDLELHANSTQCRFRVKQVLRRFVEPARVVLVWRALVEPLEFADEPVAGVRFLEKGYIVVRRPDAATAGVNDGDDGDESFAVLQQCVLSTPLFTDDNSQHPKVGALTDFVLSSTAANIAASRQMIENVLLEQAMMATTSNRMRRSDRLET